MSIQWGLAAGFLYTEVVFVIVLLIPIISPTKWKSIFQSRFIRHIQEKSHLFFNFLIIILTIFLADAIREMIKYSQTVSTAANTMMQNKVTPEYTTVDSVKEFRSQRNLYITSMALFLMFVIKRLVVLITTTADLIQDVDASNRELNALRNELATVLESKLKLAANAPEETKEDGLSDQPVKGELKDKEELRARSRSRVKKEL